MCVLRVKAADDSRPFAGLGRLLEPILPVVDELPRSQSHELRIALGMTQGSEPQPFRVAFGVLDVLAVAALDAPVVVVADDLDRLDRCTADVLCIVARWVRSDPVVVVVSGRAGRSSVLTGDALEQLKLGTFGPGRMAKQACESTPRRAYEPAFKRDV